MSERERPDMTPVLDAMGEIVDRAVAHAAEVTGRGKTIDDHQVHCERIAYAATELRAARALAEHARGSADDGLASELATVFVAEAAGRLLAAVTSHAADFGIDDDAIEKTLGSASNRALVRQGGSEVRIRDIGRSVIEAGGVNNSWLPDEMEVMTRDSVRQFARSVVEPLAQKIHEEDLLVPDDLIRQMAELGYFAMSIPEEYGGGGMGNVAMILTTEELSAASLAGAGSLITRPEILSKALVQGGTEEQKKSWLPRLASGELMVAISVTEPDVGSDVASVKCAARPGEANGEKGWLVNGAKAWCTFAGRADVIALLARTDTDASKGAKGLSLFVVEKDPFDGHEFEMKQPGGGVLTGKADATPGYRGMHSYTLGFDDYFVPAANLVGGEDGLGKGFYLQMAGFAAGRLQTGGRATGVAQAALEKTCTYVAERKQFGNPLADYQLTQYKIGRMAVETAAARHITYAAARKMDEDERAASLDAAMAKLFASDVAQRVTQEGMLLHGGWGYAVEFPISRYVVDSLVLPIFEGVKPILELKVIARGLLA